MAEKKKIVFGAAAGIATIVTTMLAGLYQREGDYSNHLNDPGGPTRFGVTQVEARNNGYKGDMRVFPKNCYEGETNTCADKVYFTKYIEAPGYVPLIKASPPVGDEIFDTSVNMGPMRPNKWLQASLMETCPSLPGLKVLTIDGRVGPGTQTYFVKCQETVGKVAFCITMLDKMDLKQKAEYDRLIKANTSLKVFYKGWINHRIGNVDRKRCATNL